MYSTSNADADDKESTTALTHATITSLSSLAAIEGLTAGQIGDVDIKIDQAIEQSLNLLRVAVHTAAWGSGLAITSTISTPSISRSLCEKIAVGCFGLPKSIMDKMTYLLDSVVWNNLASFMAQQLGTTCTLWGSFAILTLTTGVGGIPLVVGAPLLEAPAAARMVIKCACDLILILDQSFRDGGRFVTEDRIKTIAKIYMKSKVSIKEKDGIERQKPRRRAVHGAVNDLFPVLSPLAIQNHGAKSVDTFRQGIRNIIQEYRFRGKTVDYVISDDYTSDNDGFSLDISEDKDDIGQFQGLK